MRNVARLPDSDRGELFRNTADKMGLNDAIVEKDFWVCFTLDHLFHRCPWKDAITFKGGTSLSKAFNLISRFSEDIDLILDWRVLGYGKDEPWEKRSNTKQDAFNKEANARAEVFLAEQFCPTVQAEFSRELGCEANIYIDEKDKQTVIFDYRFGHGVSRCIVFNRILTGRCTNGMFRRIEEVPLRWFHFTDRPVGIADILFAGELTIGVCVIHIDKLYQP